MSMPRRVLARLFAFGAALVLLAGCSTPSPPAGTSSPQPTVSPVCAAADAFADALTASRTPSSPVPRWNRSAPPGSGRRTYDELVQAAGSVAKDRVDAVKTAEENSLPPSTTFPTTPP